jgi:hypothetical protein
VSVNDDGTQLALLAQANGVSPTSPVGYSIGSVGIADDSGPRQFSFDKCFLQRDGQTNSLDDQNQVFTETALPLLNHAFQGYNVCLFACMFSFLLSGQFLHLMKIMIELGAESFDVFSLKIAV